MDARRWQRARELFDRLADLPQSGGHARLLVDCGDDAELRDEVPRASSAPACPNRVQGAPPRAETNPRSRRRRAAR